MIDILNPGLLIILIYLPIFSLYLTNKSFAEKFLKITNSEKYKTTEIFIGITYFLIIFYAFLSSVKFNFLFYTGIFIYLLGLVLTFAGYINYATTPPNKLVKKGAYKISRNPTYFFGFIAILGVAIALQSLVLFLLLVIQFLITHQIVLQEEEYCLKKYKKEYKNYMKKTPRYLFFF